MKQTAQQEASVRFNIKTQRGVGTCSCNKQCKMNTDEDTQAKKYRTCLFWSARIFINPQHHLVNSAVP